ncbi:hypothetical protein N7535_002328 [Penicillium sp. DV-2018c]|nr:hypothetical protein N7461_004434 [Penicillium sp. DV-2018c]KAJ5583708.1 hypothetical protein N7535_002328 [Penicillium sp. DV-2018c]
MVTRLQQTIERYSLLPKDLYNFDEGGHRGKERSRKWFLRVVTASLYRCRWLGDATLVPRERGNIIWKVGTAQQTFQKTIG